MSETAGRSLLPSALRLGRTSAALLVVAWSLFVAWGLLSDKVGKSASFFGASYVFNLAHAGIFGLEALLLGFVLRPSRAPQPARDRAWLLACGLALAYSIWLEWQQGLVSGRTRSAADLITNALGIWGLPRALGEPRPSWRWFGAWIAACAAAGALATFSDL